MPSCVYRVSLAKSGCDSPKSHYYTLLKSGAKFVKFSAMGKEDHHVVYTKKPEITFKKGLLAWWVGVAERYTKQNCHLVSLLNEKKKTMMKARKMIYYV